MRAKLAGPLRIAVLVGVVLLAIAFSGSAVSPGGAAFQLLWFLAMFIFVIPVHELGHALAGALVGHQIKAIVVGMGPRLLAFRVAGVAIQVNALPLVGLTAGIPRRGTSWIRLRHWVFAAGGPAANLIVYFALRKLGGAGHGRWGDGGDQSFLAVAAAANWAVFALNVLPFRTSEGQRSDGYSLLTIPFWGRRQIDEALVAMDARPLAEALAREDFDMAMRLVEELRARYPEHPAPLSWLGLLLHRQGRHEAARAAWREGLAKNTLPERTPLLENNIAFVDVVIGDSDSLAEADRMSERAYAARPDHPAFAGTRGAVLVRLGRPAEGLALLERSLHGAPDKRGRAYNHAFMASGLALLGRADEARRALDEARGEDPTCDLLERAEADVGAAPAGAVVPAPGVAQPGGLTAALQRWGGLVRWRQAARAVAFASVIVPGTISMQMLGASLAAMFVLISPEPTGLVVFGVCTLWVAALRAAGLAGDAMEGSPWTVALAAALAVAALALAAVRGRLGARTPSKAPVVLAWLVGLNAVLANLPVLSTLVRALASARAHPRAWLAARPRLSETALLVGLVVVLALARRRWVRVLAAVPAALIVLALGAAQAELAARAIVDRIPTDGGAIVWEARRPATVLRTRQIPSRSNSVTLSPGGRAFHAVDIDWSAGKGPRSTIHAGDFEGHLVAVEGDAAAFVDDDRLIVVRGVYGMPPVTLMEIHPAQGPAAIWTRALPDLDSAGEDVDVAPDGRSIALVGRAHGERVMVRVGAAPDGAIETFRLASRSPDADRRLAAFVAPTGWAGILVSRVRLSPGMAGGGAAPYVPDDDRDFDETDVELWSLSATAETLVAAHAPELDCSRLPFGRPIMWCLARNGRRPVLLEIDPVAARMVRVAGDLPRSDQVALVGLSKIAVISDLDLGVIDVAARRGVTLELPRSTEHPWPRLARGGLATITRAGRAQDATLTVYAVP